MSLRHLVAATVAAGSLVCSTASFAQAQAAGAAGAAGAGAGAVTTALVTTAAVFGATVAIVNATDNNTTGTTGTR